MDNLSRDGNNYPAARLAEMVGLCRLCLTITRKTLDQMRSADEEDLERLIGRREEIIIRLRALEADLHLETVKGGESLPEMVERSADEFQGLLLELNKVMTDLVNTDLELKTRMESELARVGRELDRLRQGHTTLKAYSPPRGGPAFLVDRQG
ncbi:MAG: hypothetical protein AB1641_10680 [Thermodesulfobacteriota bacterium]